MMMYVVNYEKITEKISIEFTEDDWTDWKWQVRNSVRDVESLEEFLSLSLDDAVKDLMKETIQKFPMSITPYYLSLVDRNDYLTDPIFKQAVPDHRELEISSPDMCDPLHEDLDSATSCLVHRYPDRALFLVSNICSMYCRHCTRKRRVGDVDSIPSRQEIMRGIDYLRETPSIRDVLLSGGDPLMLEDSFLDWILSELRDIPHIEVIRIGSRMPAVLPFRVTDSLVDVLKKHHPLWLNTHFNHPREITPSSKKALSKLSFGGVPLGNQSVLLSGVNDCPRIMKKLVHKLVECRVRPYYIFQCDLSEGLSHFRTTVGRGIEIMENLIGHTSGFAVPTYVVDAPEGGGKIPIMPNYVISRGTNKIVLRNYEGVITTYTEPEDYSPGNCDGDCKNCNLHLVPEKVNEEGGIAGLLSDIEETISLTPENNERMERRTGSNQAV